VWVVGGGDLAGQFFDAGLLDELIIQIGSATLGSGKPLFPRRALYPSLRLVSSRPMGDGMIELRYMCNGPTSDEVMGRTEHVDNSAVNIAIPILLSRSIRATVEFYTKLGFTGHAHDNYAILRRGEIELHFSLYRELVPEESNAMCYLRVDNVDALHQELSVAQLPHSGIPRMDPVADKSWGMREFAIVDEDGNLLRVGQVN
jgi:catechol 2,3-dioxygenase-like lactoylglutathione lyase family enzyme